MAFALFTLTSLIHRRDETLFLDLKIFSLVIAPFLVPLFPSLDHSLEQLRERPWVWAMFMSVYPVMLVYGFLFTFL